MDNYLSHRWPDGSGDRSLPGLPELQPRRKGHTLRRVLAIVLVIALGLSILGGAGYLGISLLVRRHTTSKAPADSPAPSPSRTVHRTDPDWTQDDLPWGEPDPAVALTQGAGTGGVLSGRAIYDRLLPSVAAVTSQQAYGYSTGTGFVVHASGYLLTNYHVIDHGTAIQVMLLTDQTTSYDARVIGFDEEFDLAVLKIDAGELTPAPLGDSDALAVGDLVYAIGNPMGYLYGSMTDGIVSALDRENDTTGGAMGMIQTSAALNSGNSGGPLIDQRGRVVGITSAKITGMEDQTVIEGLGLAIPISDLLPFVNHILATGESWRPNIGIQCKAGSVDGRAGILVSTVQEDVPAFAAGLRPGDFIVAANGQPTPTVAALRRVLYRTGVDGSVTCAVLREGQELEIAFTLIDALEG